ncbi:MAG: J domain-containing protein [Acidimicrobiales bacterium]
MTTHYEILGVPPSASADEIRGAYRRQARLHHPDAQVERGGAPSQASRHRMAAVNTAWEVLGDPARRRRYDLDMGVGVGPAAPVAPPRVDDAWRPLHDADDFDADPDLDDDFAFDDSDEPEAPRRPSDVLVMSPVLLVGLALGTFFFANMSQSAWLRTLSILMMPVAVVGFVAAPLFAMVRSRSRR